MAETEIEESPLFKQLSFSQYNLLRNPQKIKKVTVDQLCLDFFVLIESYCSYVNLKGRNTMMSLLQYYPIFLVTFNLFSQMTAIHTLRETIGSHDEYFW